LRSGARFQLQHLAKYQIRWKQHSTFMLRYAVSYRMIYKSNK
jgi:hypothetical protein